MRRWELDIGWIAIRVLAALRLAIGATSRTTFYSFTCPACGAASFSKQVTAAGFQLKGSGWYATDFRNGSKPAPATGGEGVYAVNVTVSDGGEVIHRDIVTATRSYPAEYAGTPAETRSQLGISKVMMVTCTYDHRIIQGAESGRFLARVHALLNGEEGFYDRIFAELGLSLKPVTGRTHLFLQGGAQRGALFGQLLGQLVDAAGVAADAVHRLQPLVQQPAAARQLLTEPADRGVLGVFRAHGSRL